MKPKKHKFTLTVTTTKSKASAKSTVLCAFACRLPDGCEFHLTSHRKTKSP